MRFPPLEGTNRISLEIESPNQTDVEENLKIAVEQDAALEFG